MNAALPSRIGINAVFLEPPMGGLETYVRAVVPELIGLAPEVRFSLYCSRPGLESLRGEDWAGEVELITHPLLGIPGVKALAEMTLLGALAGRHVQLLHSVAFTAPLRTRSVNVVMVPDVIWILHPDQDHPHTMRLWRTIVPPIARRADRVIAISHSGAEEIVRYLHVPAGRIDVVPLGPGITPHAKPTAEHELRRRLGLGAGPIVLGVSAKKAHKNLARLVEAMAEVLHAHPDAVLVLPGRPTEYEDELRGLAEGLGMRGGVVLPPYVDDSDLEGLYACAACFVCPSLTEGFGLPVLEAMRRGVPVACSNVSALPEVAGDAALYFDPLDVGQIAGAACTLLEDRALASRLAVAGRERAGEFSWRATAEGTLETYERAWHADRRRRPG
ncbi:MAG TPA: glycosyltransferase family 1 protein [Solirubrobacteraceae bacterium]|nr:glycosyltransferase family 1 protein [Solirubrobacteraceae bacterium]